jgi:dTDP-4-dehydrorhamnose reductase
MWMNLLVTGAAGMLGSALCPVLREEGHQVLSTDIRMIAEDIDFLDVRELEQVKAYCCKNLPNAILHLAAETDLELCETHVGHAYSTNTLGTRNIAWICRDMNIPMLYVSSIGVFDGTKIGPYDENDVPNPINVYGRTKWAGEIIVESVLKKYFIVRAGWMIGGGEREKKFVALIIRQLRDGAGQIRVVMDKFGTPTYNADFSQGLARLIVTEHYGTFHLSSGASISRYQVAEKILEVLGYSGVELIGVSSDSEYIKSRFPTLRPREESMISIKTAGIGLDCMRPWDMALKEYLLANYR